MNKELRLALRRPWLIQLLEVVPMSAVVSQFVPLHRRYEHDDYMRGLCPFHQERTPSFTVSDSKERIHCFGCGEKFGGQWGKVLFLQRVQGVDAAHAITLIAELAQFKIPPFPGKRRAPRWRKRKAKRMRRKKI